MSLVLVCWVEQLEDFLASDLLTSSFSLNILFLKEYMEGGQGFQLTGTSKPLTGEGGTNGVDKDVPFKRSM